MSIQAGTPAKPAEILLMLIFLMMSISSLLYISAGNLTGLSESISVTAVAKLPLYTGTPKFTNTMTTLQPKKLLAR